MLVYSVPSYTDYHHPSAPPTLYPLSRFGVSRPPTAREKYLRAVAEAQSARQNYVRELEEQRFLESLRQQEALREAELRHHEALRQAALRQRLARNFIERRRPGRGTLFIGPDATALPFTRQQKVHPDIEQHQDQLRAVEELLGALIRPDAEAVGEETLRQQHASHEARAHHAVKDACGFGRVDKTRQEVPRDPHTDKAKPACAGPHHAPDDAYKIFVKLPFGPYPTPHGTDTTSAQPPSATPLSRKSEVPRARDRAARTIQRQWRSHSADAAARKDAVETIDMLRARFYFLRDAFTFPEHLEFRELEGRAQETDVGVPALSYSPLNASVHAYTNELTKLLINADAVPSGGSKRVRDIRRAFVQDVEEQLAAVEARVRKIWGKRAESPAVDRQDTSITTPMDGVDAHVAAEPAPEPEALPESVPVPQSLDSIHADIPLPTSEHQLRSHETDSHSGEEAGDAAQDILMSLEDDSNLAETNVAIENASTTESADIKQDALVDGVDKDAGILNVAQHTDEVEPSLEPVSPSLSMAPEPERLAPSAVPSSAPTSDITNPTETIDVDTPAPIHSTPESRAAPEPFDVVYPDSESEVSVRPESDAAHSHRGTDTVVPKPDQRRDEDIEEFEIL